MGIGIANVLITVILGIVAKAKGFQSEVADLIPVWDSLVLSSSDIEK